MNWTPSQAETEAIQKFIKEFQASHPGATKKQIKKAVIKTFKIKIIKQ